MAAKKSKAMAKATATAKATIYNAVIEPTNVKPSAEDGLFAQYGALEAPYHPAYLCRLFERSHALRPNVDVYAVNIEGHGHRFEPTINLEDEKADDKIRDAILLEKLYDGEDAPAVDDAEVLVRRQQVEAAMRLERLQLEVFFEFACPDMSFIELREQTRQDQEVTGNGYWECVRDQNGRLSQFYYAASIVMRLMPLDLALVDTEVQQKVSALSYRALPMRRRFRRYVQVVEGLEVAFFKELGDRRVMSSKTGRFYLTPEELERDEPGVSQATEVLHFKVHSPSSVYGVPRWIGATPAIIGSREAEEVNLLYFYQKGVPPLAITVSGGTLAKGAVERIKNYIKDEIKGKSNFWSILVLEAEGKPSAPGATPPRVQIEIKPLMDAQLKDALFLNYDARNTEKVGCSSACRGCCAATSPTSTAPPPRPPSSTPSARSSSRSAARSTT